MLVLGPGVLGALEKPLQLHWDFGGSLWFQFPGDLSWRDVGISWQLHGRFFSKQTNGLEFGIGIWRKSGSSAVCFQETFKSQWAFSSGRDCSLLARPMTFDVWSVMPRTKLLINRQIQQDKMQMFRLAEGGRWWATNFDENLIWWPRIWPRMAVNFRPRHISIIWGIMNLLESGRMKRPFVEFAKRIFAIVSFGPLPSQLYPLP